MSFAYVLLITYLVGFSIMMISGIVYYLSIFKLSKLIKTQKKIHAKIYPKLPEYLFLWMWFVMLVRMFIAVIREPEIFSFSKEAKKHAMRANRAATLFLIVFFTILAIAAYQLLTIGTIHL